MTSPSLALPLRRRQFVTGLASGLGLAAAGFSLRAGASQREQLTGTRFDLHIGETLVNFTGKQRRAITVNNQLPAPTLRWREGERVTLRVTNHLKVDTSIHWHGIILPTGMDGVPGLSFAGIKPGQTFTYSFDVNQSGTYWYHSHSGFQEQQGLYGAIVVEPASPEPVSFDREHVVMLSDWSDNAPEDIYATLKKVSHYYNMNERTLFDTLRDFREKGVAQTLRDRKMWNLMRMSDSDLSDVTGYTYSFLMNGQTPAQNWRGLFRAGERVKLRFINAAAMTFFDIRIPGLKMTVVATDGQPIHPVTVDEMRIGVAETYDVIVEPDSDSAYSIFCQALDRSGYAVGTLAADSTLSAPIPALDPVPILGHREMGMAHDMAHGDHGSMDHSDMSHADTRHADMNHANMNHDAPNHAAMGHTGDHSAMDHGNMDHSGHGTAPRDQPPLEPGPGTAR